jgi:hypothetical protein
MRVKVYVMGKNGSWAHKKMCKRLHRVEVDLTTAKRGIHDVERSAGVLACIRRGVSPDGVSVRDPICA